MFVIRKDQFAILGQARLRDFERKAVRHVRACFPTVCAVLSGEDIEAHVKDGIGRAQGQGFEDEVDILRFLNLQFTLGQDFDRENTWAVHTLADPRFAPRTKIDLLVQQALAELAPPLPPAQAPVFKEGTPEPEPPFDGLLLEEEPEVPSFEEGNLEPVTDIWTPVAA